MRNERVEGGLCPSARFPTQVRGNQAPPNPAARLILRGSLGLEENGRWQLSGILEMTRDLSIRLGTGGGGKSNQCKNPQLPLTSDLLQLQAHELPSKV